MAADSIAAAWHRAESALKRRPEMGLHDDAPATARWEGGSRVTSCHANGTQVQTDMPAELGGSGDKVTPGWLLRAGIAACTATRIGMAAAAQDIELTSLEVTTSSRSDLRGLLGMQETDGTPVSAAPREVQLHVRIAARNVPAERLRKLVEDSYDCSPMARAVKDSVPMDLQVEITTG